ncbi:hypothetical protein R6Q59_035438 [Mikania micrantha]
MFSLLSLPKAQSPKEKLEASADRSTTPANRRSAPSSLGPTLTQATQRRSAVCTAPRPHIRRSAASTGRSAPSSLQQVDLHQHSLHTFTGSSAYNKIRDAESGSGWIQSRLKLNSVSYRFSYERF